MPTIKVSRDTVKQCVCDTLAVGVFNDGTLGPGAREVEAALGLTLAELSEQVPVLAKPERQFSGELGEAILVATLGKLAAAQVLVVGLGSRAEASAKAMRRAGATVARRAGGATSLATTIPQAARGGAAANAGAFVEGFLLGSYKYLRYRAKKDSRPNRISEVQLLAGRGWDARAVGKAIQRAEHIAEGTNLARDLTNTPSNDKSPESLAAEARKMARNGLKVKVWDEKQLEAQGFGGILGVGRGSRKPPRLIELRYEPKGAKRTIAIVGKGITFDSGGINLKPGNSGIDWMKMDMGGGGAVLGAMLAISKLKPKVAVRAYVATAENMPDGDALRPGDVITQYGGTTVEIGNTDAEGRLVMADAIAYAREKGADVIVDIATLTGACVIALGNKVFGVLGDPRSEVARMLKAADAAGENAWELPLQSEYRIVMDSDIADLRNVPSKNVGAGTITAALFLKEFAQDTPWVHIDIAGPAKADEDDFERPKWATGSGVRTLVEYVLSQ